MYAFARMGLGANPKIGKWMLRRVALGTQIVEQRINSEV